MTTTTARCLAFLPLYPVSAGNNATTRTRRRIKMSNQICRQSPRAVAVNYMARLFSAPARPCTQQQRSKHQHPRISLTPIDMCTWYRLPYSWLPASHRTHAAAPSRDDRCRVVWRASTHRLEMPIYILQQSRCRSERIVPHPRVRPRPACCLEGPYPKDLSTDRSSHGRFHPNLTNLSSHMVYAERKTLSTRGTRYILSHESRQDLSVDPGTCAYIVPSCTWRSGS